MKRVLLLAIALCVGTTASFGQKKAVSQAQKIAKTQNADFNEARELIKGALTDPETKDDPKTWYVAGFVEDQQFSNERTKQILGQQPNDKVMYDALMNSYPYFQKSYDLDQLPDVKGKVKPKYTKDIKSIISANHIYYFNGGAYYFEERDYKKSCDFFETYLDIANNPMFAGERVAERDSNYMLVTFYAAVAATESDDKAYTMKALKRAAEQDYRRSDILQYLAYEYQLAGDSVNQEKTLIEGMEKYSDVDWFIENLISFYILSNRNEEAIDCMKKAVAAKPDNAEIYDLIGKIYEINLSQPDEAENYFKKAQELDPENVEYLSNMGRLYFNRAVNKQSDANMLTDNKAYQEELEKAKELFRQALPYYEKAHQIDPTVQECILGLRGIYYNLNMGDKYEEMNKLLPDTNEE